MSGGLKCTEVLKSVERLFRKKKNWVLTADICEDMNTQDKEGVSACLSLLHVDGFVELEGRWPAEIQVKPKQGGPPLCIICKNSSLGKVVPIELNINGYPRALPICERCIEEKQCPVCCGEFAGNGKITRRCGGVTSTETCFGCEGTGKYHY